MPPAAADVLSHMMPLLLLPPPLLLLVSCQAAVRTCGATNNDAIHSICYLQLNQPVICTQVKLAIGQVPTCRTARIFKHKDEGRGRIKWQQGCNPPASGNAAGMRMQGDMQSTWEVYSSCTG
jgi:hypothetical protein